MNSLLDVLEMRQSQPLLGEPAPSEAIIERLVRGALTAPDHAGLHPSRFLMIGGSRREALGELFVRAVQSRNTEVSAEELERTRSMPLRAPLLVVGICQTREHPKVPLLEQQISTGVALGYFLLGLQAAGFGGMWRTGWVVDDPVVRQGLGLAEHEQIIGFLYAGTVTSPKRPSPRPTSNESMAWW